MFYRFYVLHLSRFCCNHFERNLFSTATISAIRSIAFESVEDEKHYIFAHEILYKLYRLLKLQEKISSKAVNCYANHNEPQQLMVIMTSTSESA